MRTEASAGCSGEYSGVIDANVSSAAAGVSETARLSRCLIEVGHPTSGWIRRDEIEVVKEVCSANGLVKSVGLC